MTFQNTTQRNLILFVLVALLAFLAYDYLRAPDQRSTGQHVGDAIDALPQGVGKASRELEDRTPGQKIGDSLKDAGDKVKDSTAP